MKTVRSFLVLALVALMLCPGLAVVAYAADYVSGDWTYTLNSGEATIKKYTGSALSVTIPSKLDGYTVIAIGSEAFRYNKNITSVSIGSNVTSIGWRAFNDCTGLKSISLPNSVRTMDTYAFCGCTSMTSVEIGTGLQEIPEYCFHGNTSLSSVKIGTGVTKINGNAFSDCTALSSITWGNGLKEIGGSAFYNCLSLTSVSVPNTVTTIGDSAFRYCSGITSLTLGSGLKTIGWRAFNDCTGIKSVKIPDSVTAMSSYAFCGCTRVTSVEIGTGLQEISEYCFHGDIRLASVKIGTGVTKINGNAFSDCTALSSITWGNSLKEIGGSAFYNCSSLTSVSVPNTVTTIGDSAFKYCSGITSLTLGSGLKTIGWSAFRDCSKITSIAVPNSVTKIEGYAFCNCTQIKKVYLDTYLQEIGHDAFDNTGITDVYYSGSSSDRSNLSINNSGNDKLINATWHYNYISSYVLSYSANGGSGAPSNQTGSTSYTISSTVPTRFGYTFLGWSKSSSATSSSYTPGSTISLTANTSLYAVWKAATTIPNGSTTNVTVSFSSQEWFYKFVPSSSGTYQFETSGSLDTYGYLYDSSGSKLASDDDSAGSNNFRIEYSLTSGTTYYLKVKGYGSKTGSTTVKVSGGTTTTYTVTYNANGGTVSSTSASVSSGDSVTLPTPSKSYKITYNANNGSGAPSAQTVNLTCKGWSTSSSATSASYSCGTNYKPNGSVTLYAVWNSPVSATISSITPTRSGYAFLGWATSSSATSASYSSGGVISLSSNVTLYAVWNANPSSYTLSYSANGGSGAPSNQTGSTSYTISSTVPTRFGYTFLGWSKSSSATSASYTPGSTISLTANTTLHAVWKAAVTISSGSSTNTTISFAHQTWFYKFVPSSSGTYRLETSGSLDTYGYLYNSSGSELASDDDSAGSNNFRIEHSLTSGTTYYLKVKGYGSKTGSTTVKVSGVATTTYTVTYNASGGTVSPTSDSVSAGSSVTLPTPTKGYYITYDANGGSGAPSRQTANLTCKGWSMSSSATSASYSCGTSYKPNGNTTLYAVWNPSASVNLSSIKPTRTNYRFLGWSTSQNATSAEFTSGQSATVRDGDITLYAVWQWDGSTSLNAKIVLKTSKIVLSTQWEALGVCAFTLDGENGSYNLKWGSSDSNVVSTNNYAVELDDGVIGFAMRPNNPGKATISLKLFDASGSQLIDSATVDVEVISNYYTDSVRMSYHSHRTFSWDSFAPYVYISDNDNIVTVNEETGDGYARSRGVTYVEGQDEYGNMRITRVEVYYSLFDWIILILLFGWLWY